MPGAIAPPRYAPSREITSNVIAVPKSTTMRGAPYFSRAGYGVHYAVRPYAGRVLHLYRESRVELRQ